MLITTDDTDLLNLLENLKFVRDDHFNLLLKTCIQKKIPQLAIIATSFDNADYFLCFKMFVIMCYQVVQNNNNYVIIYFLNTYYFLKKINH